MLRIVILLISLILFNSSAYALDVDNVRFGKHPDKIRIVVEVSEHTEFKAFTLPKIEGKPYRLVLDLPAFNWNASSIKQTKGIPITDVRTSDDESSIRRIAFDLKAPVLIKDAFIIEKKDNKPDRIVLDIRNVSEQAFKKSARKEFGTLEAKKELNNRTLSEVIANNIEAAPQTVTPELPTSAAGLPIPKRKPPTKIPTKQPSAPITPLYRPLIVIDAGHGGADPGAIGANKTYEKHVTLSAAKLLKKKLESNKQYRVALTRANDRYIKLYKRVSIARAQEADLFISLHADSIDNPRVRGASVYTLSNKASDAQTAKLAARENQADLIAGVDLSHEDKEVANILLDLAMRDTMNQSKFFANTLVTNMRKYGIRTLDRPHRYAGFAVLKAPDIPSVLIEMGFMSNRSEARLLLTRDYQEKVSKAIKSSVDAYFAKVSKNTQ